MLGMDILYIKELPSPLGKMRAISNEHNLLSLYFLTEKKFFFEEQLEEKGTRFFAQETSPLSSIEEELEAYFKGELFVFKTPIFLSGTSFQKLAWKALLEIPYGKIEHYQYQSEFIGNKYAWRAIGNANGMNPLLIRIPCHRICRKDGKLGGFSLGVSRKKWLIDHEQSCRTKEGFF